jgi:hypothetical protein
MLGPVVSVVALDSLDSTDDTDSLLERTGAALREQGIQVNFTLVPLSIQKSSHGCCIFALSLAKKMQNCEQFLRERHAPGLYGLNVDQPAAPLSHYKHATSLTALEGARGAVGDEAFTNDVVNKQGQTLSERANAGRIVVTHPQTGQTRNMNVSYMAKRIQFYERACYVYQQEARLRGLSIDPLVRQHMDVPTSSVLPRLDQLRQTDLYVPSSFDDDFVDPPLVPMTQAKGQQKPPKDNGDG